MQNFLNLWIWLPHLRFLNSYTGRGNSPLISMIMKKGDKIRNIRMDDSNCKDLQARQMNGRVWACVIYFAQDLLVNENHWFCNQIWWYFYEVYNWKHKGNASWRPDKAWAEQEEDKLEEIRCQHRRTLADTQCCHKWKKGNQSSYCPQDREWDRLLGGAPYDASGILWYCEA